MSAVITADSTTFLSWIPPRQLAHNGQHWRVFPRQRGQ